MVFVLDNYDSFTYNLVQYLGELGAEVVVRRNDELTVKKSRPCIPSAFFFRPAPALPARPASWFPHPPHGRQGAHPRRLPRTSGHRRGLWR